MDAPNATPRTHGDACYCDPCWAKKIDRLLDGLAAGIVARRWEATPEQTERIVANVMAGRGPFEGPP